MYSILFLEYLRHAQNKKQQKTKQQQPTDTLIRWKTWVEKWEEELLTYCGHNGSDKVKRSNIVPTSGLSFYKTGSAGISVLL